MLWWGLGSQKPLESPRQAYLGVGGAHGSREGRPSLWGCCEEGGRAAGRTAALLAQLPHLPLWGTGIERYIKIQTILKITERKIYISEGDNHSNHFHSKVIKICIVNMNSEIGGCTHRHRREHILRKGRDFQSHFWQIPLIKNPRRENMGGRWRVMRGKKRPKLWQKLRIQIIFTNFPLADILPGMWSHVIRWLIWIIHRGRGYSGPSTECSDVWWHRRPRGCLTPSICCHVHPLQRSVRTATVTSKPDKPLPASAAGLSAESHPGSLLETLISDGEMEISVLCLFCFL